MKSWLKFLVVFFAVVVLTVLGCASNPVSTSNTNNNEVSVSLLFTHDGCNIYRFMDGGYYRYYAVCGNHVTTDYEVPQGKTTRPESITTVVR